MPIEVERTAIVHDVQHVRTRLSAYTSGSVSTYRDVYYDWPDRALERDGRRELRLRDIVEADGARRTLLTYKGSATDGAVMPEFETEVADPDMMDMILAGLGLGHTIAYQKLCENFRFDVAGRSILATVVRVPELEPTFIEVETIVGSPGEDVPEALAAVDRVLADLGIPPADFTTEFYIDLVTAERHRAG
ncbi:class IV adenylate cyclase [Longispora albida]|uniref:class IV adenylate cyclase n=1 Tax=Longispora albida TaxID=203523 RepID=UPI0003648AE5|nr:class IV adenylate cyclase [Longispora albida]